MTTPDGRCAEHPDLPAAFVCPRCGDFACDACARRVTPSAQPLCAGCWRKRENVAVELEGRASRYRRWLILSAIGVVVVWLGAIVASFALVD